MKIYHTLDGAPVVQTSGASTSEKVTENSNVEPLASIYYLYYPVNPHSYPKPVE
jgi:hypothetical protein